MADYIAARTEFFDSALLSACEAGTQQVVLVAAGYDGRSLRFRQPGVSFFEVDHPRTQADKLARLHELGIDADDVRFVPVDLGRDSVKDALALAGHDGERATHFMCEGLTPYLPRAVLVQLLRSLASRAAPGSTIAVDFATRGRDLDAINRLRLNVVRASTTMMGERMVTFVTGSEAQSLLTGTGWTRVELAPTPPSFPVLFAVALAG